MAAQALGAPSSAEPHADPVFSPASRMTRAESGSWVLAPDSSEGSLGALGEMCQDAFRPEQTGLEGWLHPAPTKVSLL